MHGVRRRHGRPRQHLRHGLSSPFRVSVCAARTLNVTGQSRVTLSPRQEHLRAACEQRQEDRELKSAQHDYSQATSSYKRLQPLVAYCQANHTTNDCKSSKGVELDEVMQVCCGAKAKRCAAGKLPKLSIPHDSLELQHASLRE